METYNSLPQLISEISSLTTIERRDEFIISERDETFIEIDDLTVEYSSDCLDVTLYYHDGWIELLLWDSGIFHILIRPDIQICCNVTCCTEESLFMHSTVHDIGNLTVSDVNVIKTVWDFFMVNYQQTIRDFKKSLPTLLEVMKCSVYLYSVGVNSTIPTYEEFNITDSDGSEVKIAFSFGDWEQHYTLELHSYNCNSYLYIEKNHISFCDDVRDDFRIEMFRIDNPRSITTEEDFFQATTVHDLSTLNNDLEFLPLVMKTFDEIEEMVRSCKKDEV